MHRQQHTERRARTRSADDVDTATRLGDDAVHRLETDAGAAPWRLRRLDIWLPLVIVVLDQITKYFVRANVPLYSTVTVIPGFMNITHVLNTGAAFGILNSADFPPSLPPPP